jgi:hypothetical protein
MTTAFLKTALKRLVLACFPALAPTGSLSLGEALPWLVPKVRPRFVYETAVLRTGRLAPQFRLLAGIFAVSLAVDLPQRTLDVDVATLKRWDADFDALLQKARSNLVGRGGEEGFRRLGPGRYRSTWQDGLDGSRLLLPGVLRCLNLDGDPVVVLPSPDTMLVVGSEDIPALRWALAGALEFLDSDPRALNGCPLRLRHFDWEPFQVQAGHPLRPLLEQMRQRRLRDEYVRQKALLDHRNDLAGVPITVAPFHLVRTPGGQVASYTTWTPDQGEVWLPEADRVCLAWESGGREQKAWMTWDALKRRLSHLLEPAGLFPERYRLRECPGRDLLERLLA